MSVYLQKFQSPAWPLFALLYILESIAKLPILWALLVVALHVLVAVVLVVVAILVRPRVVEDLAFLHLWFDLRSRGGHDPSAAGVVVTVLLLPLTVLLQIVFALLSITVRSAYRLAFSLQAFRCPSCRERIKWVREKLRCEHCGHLYTGTMDTPCPRCLFAPNGTRCPHCAYLFTHGLGGHGPSALARTGRDEEVPA